ncbi:YajG family lipoprotein, partial [Vibrio parahaemolyticus]|nr:YajG family lipoprotein [Vibrio parahaemolyticus]
VTLELTAETPKGKMVKSYNGTAKRTAPLSASDEDIEMVLNDVVNLVLKEIANDSELKTYMKDHFHG